MKEKYPLINFRFFGNNGVLLITGDSGAGLTTTARTLSHFLIKKEFYKEAVIFSRISGAFEYVMDNNRGKYLHRSFDIDYPEVLEGSKEVKDVFIDLKNKIKERMEDYYLPKYYLFDVKKLLKPKQYNNIIKGFFKYFTEVENQILIIDNISVLKEFIDSIDTIRKAGENNLIVINVQELEKEFIDQFKKGLSILILDLKPASKENLIHHLKLIPEELKNEFFHTRWEYNKFQDVLVLTDQIQDFYELPYIYRYEHLDWI